MTYTRVIVGLVLLVLAAGDVALHIQLKKEREFQIVTTALRARWKAHAVARGVQVEKLVVLVEAWQKRALDAEAGLTRRRSR